MDSFINAFHIDLKIIIAQAVNFVVVLLILHFILIKPLKKVMAERSKKIEQGIEDAKCNADALRATKDEYTKIINEAKSEANKIFQEGKSQAEAKKAEMLEKAVADVENLVSNGKKALEREKVAMVEEARKEIVSLVVAATEKLLSDEADTKLDAKLTKRITKI
jgi:F-type H+-transporting ATPase subunit b